jgi:hypothetical protein
MTVSSSRNGVLRLVVGAAFATAVGVIVDHTIGAQQGATPAAPAVPTPQTAAPFDPTGYWVSVVTEDWRWRMVTPTRGDVDGVPLNPAGLKMALSWDFAKDVATPGAQCKAYGGAAIMRMPTRLHTTWAPDGKSLKVETDAGTQVRTLNFNPAATAAPRSLQGTSIASWIDMGGGRGRGGRGGGGGAAAAVADDETAAPQGAAAQLAQANDAARGTAPAPPPGQGRVGGAATPAPANGGPAAGAANAGGGRGRAAGGGGRAAYGNGTLKVVTTNLRAGYLRKNGVPYSENATVTEYFDRLPGPNNSQWLVVRTTVDDPTYLTGPFTVSSNFKLEPDGSKWQPSPCLIDPPLVPGEHGRIPFRPADVETIGR